MKLRTKEGRLTPYAYACGYVDNYWSPTRKTHVSLDRIHGGLYRVSGEINNEVVHFYYEILTEARSKFKSLAHKITFDK